MKNLIITIALIILMVLFLGFQKDANNLRLKILNLEKITKDSADYLTIKAKKGEKIESLQKELFAFLEKNRYKSHVKQAQVRLNEEKKVLEVQLDIGIIQYGLNFLNNDQHVVRTARIEF